MQIFYFIFQQCTYIHYIVYIYIYIRYQNFPYEPSLDVSIRPNLFVYGYYQFIRRYKYGSLLNFTSFCKVQHRGVLSVLLFTACDYPFSIFTHLVIVLSVLRFTLITSLVSLVFCVMFYRSLFALLSFGHCISVLRFTLITPLV